MLVVLEVDEVPVNNMLAKMAANEEGAPLDGAATHSPESIEHMVHVDEDVHLGVLPRAHPCPSSIWLTWVMMFMWVMMLLCLEC